MFAKTTSEMQRYRKSKAISKFEKEPVAESKEEKPSAGRKQIPGEAVTSVSTSEVYEIYRVEHGKETLVVRDGATVKRTGRQILEKMSFNKRLGVWVSKNKGYKYKVRKSNQ